MVHAIARRKILTLTTIITVVISISSFLSLPGLQVQQAWAHIDPPGCNSPNSQISITALRGADPILGTGPVIQGETITFRVNLDAASDLMRCSREGGLITIFTPTDTKNAGLGTNTTPAGGIPCIGVNGDNNFDDSDPPSPSGPNDGTLPDGDDCDEGADGDGDNGVITDNRSTVVSNPLNYTVDCSDLTEGGEFAGKLLATALWSGGRDHIVSSVSDSPAGGASANRPLDCVLPTIEWEKRLLSGAAGSHPLQGGATFKIMPDPFDADPSLNVTDNGPNDVNPAVGQIKLNGTELGTFTIQEITPPPNCTVDTGVRSVTVSVAEPIQVIGTQGVDDDGGNVNERDFHNTCPGMIEWEKRQKTDTVPHPLQGGATFRVTPSPFAASGSFDVVDNGANDIDMDAGQIKLNGTLLGSYTVKEIVAPPGCSPDPDPRTITLSLAAPNQVIGTQGVDDDGGNLDERDFHNTCDGTIIIKKNTEPDDPQDFSFTHNITSDPSVPSPFKLDDDPSSALSNMKNFFKVPAGSYRVTETIVKEIPLQNIICEDPTGDSFRSGNSAIIELASGETVTCTFRNGMQVPLCGDGIIAENQPQDAISMTSIRNGSILKTIHAEKQIFNCELDQGEIPVIADVTIIAEIYENIDTKTILSKQAVAITCIKAPDRVRMLECDASTPSTDRIPVTNCIESEIQHPQEMNSIQKGNTAKTIETQKEVFECTMNTPQDPTDDKKVDLLLFTELFQNLNLQTTQDPQIMSMKCVIKIDTVTVEACRFANHPV